MKSLLLSVLLSVTSTALWASEVAGTWKTIDDETKQPKALVQMTEGANGELTGKVLKLFTQADARCDKCEGDKQGKPIVGMQILWGLKKKGDVWEGGQILDPKNGKTYTASVKPIENGKRLQVRGHIGPFYRTQVWER